MQENEELEEMSFKVGMFLAFGVGLAICIFGDRPFFEYVVLGITLIVFALLLGAVQGVMPINYLAAFLLNMFNCGWFFYWFYFESQLLISLVFPIGLMLFLFVVSGFVFRKKIIEDYLKRADKK